MYKYNANLKHQNMLLIDMVKNGAEVLVEIKKGIFEDDYLEPGMRAKIVKVKEDYTHLNDGETEGEEDIIYQITLDFSDFVDYNEKFETANYYDADGVPCLTATQAGTKPKDFIQETFCSVTHQLLPFEEIESEAARLYNIYKEEKSELSYLSWLEKKVLATL